MARLSALAVKLGLDERRVVLDEAKAKVFVLGVSRLLDGLGLDEVQRSRVGGLVREVFGSLDGSVVDGVGVGLGEGVSAVFGSFEFVERGSSSGSVVLDVDGGEVVGGVSIVTGKHS